MMRKTVLIVDDSPMIRRIVGQLLKGCGYGVLFAENGEKGCEMAHEHQPDLVLMDVEMPLMDGIEATNRLKSDAATSRIPVLIFTSLGSEEDIIRAKEAGCSGFMNKPICKDELQSSIRQILDPER